MPELRPNSWKVLCFIMRKTLGWGKDADQLSYPELRAGTGIASDSTLSSAIKDLVSLQFIVVSAGDEWEASTYHLNTTLEIDPSTSEIVVGASTTETVAVSTAKTVVGSTAKTVAVSTTETVGNKRKGKKLIKEKKESALAERAEAAPPPTPTRPAPPQTEEQPAEPPKPRLANDSYDMPDVSGRFPSPGSGAPSSRPAAKFKSRHYDPRKAIDGYIPEGKGTTAVEVYYEWHTVSEYALTMPNQDDIMRQVTDLDKWRAAVRAWAQAGHKARNISGQLDWYRDPSRYAPPPSKANRKGVTNELSNAADDADLPEHDPAVWDTSNITF